MMGDLAENLYCAEQISIPPTFPYLLRQYAKAAIRTQPIDLLRWSATYFRCLSLNLPPPVKTRLEYPVPESWHGLTPGWVRTIFRQFHPAPQVQFKELWDKWIGACMEHLQLLQLLCLGGFQDAHAIPLLKFIGLCASMMSESLTQTMIRVCEILTDEPEGGSASITIENFMSIYEFLANIDASEGRFARNATFSDSLLGLWKEKRQKFEEEVAAAESEEEGEASSEHVVEEVEEGVASLKSEIEKVASCPSIKENEFEKIEDYLEAQEILADDEEEMETETSSATDVGGVGGAPSTLETDELEHDKQRQAEFKKEERQVLADMSEKEVAAFEKEQLEGKVGKLPKAKLPAEDPDFEEKGLLEDLERLRALQEEMRGEDDHEVEEFKAQLIKQLEKTPSELEAMSHFASKLHDKTEEVLEVVDKEHEDSEVAEESEEEISVIEDDLNKFDEIYLEAVAGIGPKVPEEMVREVERYMQEMAKLQHGMVMPRNIRHYDCPPLERLKDLMAETKKMDDFSK